MPARHVPGPMLARAEFLVIVNAVGCRKRKKDQSSLDAVHTQPPHSIFLLSLPFFVASNCQSIMDNEERAWHRRWVHPAEYSTLNGFDNSRDLEHARACLVNGFVRDNEQDREAHDRNERARMREEGYELNYRSPWKSHPSFLQYSTLHALSSPPRNRRRRDPNEGRLTPRDKDDDDHRDRDRDRDRDRRPRYRDSSVERLGRGESYRPRSPRGVADSYRRAPSAADTYVPRAPRPRSRSPTIFRRRSRSRSPRGDRYRDDDRYTSKDDRYRERDRNDDRPRSPPRRGYTPRDDHRREPRARSPVRERYAHSPPRRQPMAPRRRDQSPASRNRDYRSPPPKRERDESPSNRDRDRSVHSFIRSSLRM